MCYPVWASADARDTATKAEQEAVQQRDEARNANVQLRTAQDELRRSELRAVALWKLESHTNEEIAAKLGCVVLRVERKLRSMLRGLRTETTALITKGGD